MLIRAIALTAAISLAAGCASKSSIPANDSAVNIQASTTATSDVKFIEIIVHQLSDGALVYDSGLQPSSDFQDTRQHLEENVALEGATDFLFDAKAFDVNQNLLKNGNQVQEATQPAGISTTVLIVIDLNAGDTGVVSPADITAVTDNIPVLQPPTLTRSGNDFILNYKATDIDQDPDGGPIDSNETLTFFSSILSGNVNLSDNLTPGLFTEGQTFAVSFNDDQPVKILSAVVDRLNQLTFAITIIDPVSGSFQTIEYGEGYALFDDNTLVPSPKKDHHDKNIGDPTGPHTGPIAVAVLKHGIVPVGFKPLYFVAPPSYSVEAISRSDDSLVVTPNNEAYWSSSAVASFNRYEEQPDVNGNIVIDFKLRVKITAPPGTSFTNSPPPTEIVDTIKFVSDNNNHFVFEQESAEQATLPMPLVGQVSGGTAPSASAFVDGSWFDGSYHQPSVVDTNPGLDERQIYLQDSSNPAHYVYPIAIQLVSGGSSSEVDFQIPASATEGTYDLILCTYGRNCTAALGAFVVQTSETFLVVPSSFAQGYATAINDSGVISGYVVDPSGEPVTGAVWQGMNATPILLAPLDPSDLVTQVFDINASGELIGDEDNGSQCTGVVWDANTLVPSALALAPGVLATDCVLPQRINDKGDIVGLYQTPNSATPGDTATHALAWTQSGGTLTAVALTEPALDPGTGAEISGASGINNAGLIVGSAGYTGDSNGTGASYHNYVWSSAAAIPFQLPDPPGSSGSAVDFVNDSDLIVGSVNFAGSSGASTFAEAWVPSGESWAPVQLPLPAGSWNQAQAFGANASNRIVGYVYDSTTNTSAAVLWIPDGNGNWTPNLVPGMDAPIAVGMNNSDVLVGTDDLNDGNVYPVAWTTGL